MPITTGFGPKFYPWKASSVYGKVIPGPFQDYFCDLFSPSIYLIMKSALCATSISKILRTHSAWHCQGADA